MLAIEKKEATSDSPHGLRCPDCPAEEHELSNPQVPSGQRNRERGRGSLGWWGTLPRSMFCVKAGSR